MRRGKAAILTAIRKKKYWRRADAEQVLKALSESGLSVAAFCRERGFKQERVRRWRSTLGVDEVSHKAVELLPVRLVEHQAPPRVHAEMQVVLRNGRRIAVKGSLDDALLTELAKVVESWGC